MIYEITIAGRLDPKWAKNFPEWSVTIISPKEELERTVLRGENLDQSALRGFLNQLWDLNLTLISVISYDKGLGGND